MYMANGNQLSLKLECHNRSIREEMNILLTYLLYYSVYKSRVNFTNLYLRTSYAFQKNL